MDEKVLVQQLRRKEPGAFKEVVELYQDRVLNTCFRFLFNREDAEDVAQEVFVEVYRSISSFRAEAKLSTWIYHIAVSRSIDLIRKKKRKKRFGQMKSLLSMEEEGKELPAPAGNDPLEKLEQEERMSILKEAIDTLPESQRIAFTLSKCEGIGNKKIAEIMGLTLSSVESLMHRAKKNLEKKLYRYFEKDLTKRKKILIILFLILVFQVGVCLTIYQGGSFRENACFAPRVPPAKAFNKKFLEVSEPFFKKVLTTPGKFFFVLTSK